MLGLAAYVRRERIQVLHATDRPRDALACVLLARLTGAKALIHVHVKFDQWMSRGQKWALGQADMLVGVSEFVAESLRAGGYDGARVRAVLNAIEPSDWNPDSSPAPGRASLGVSADAPLIVSVSRLFSWKGHAELLRALALVKRELPEVRLAIVGADYPEGSGVTRALAQQAAELGLTENVIFTGQRRDVPALMAACDVFALPSFEEPFGLVYTEAMAMRKPVVALRNGGAPEVVSHGENGLLSPPKDDAALAANLLVLLRQPELRARFGAHGRKSVEERFSPARLARDFGALYTQLAG
jgi:glycosyltransferase involved in cell wall biosynthesis